MRRPLLILAALALAGAALFYAGHRTAAWLCATRQARAADDLDWLRLEFRLSGAELDRVRALHEGYLPVCRQWCERIDLQKRELQAALETVPSDAARVEQQLLQIGQLRAQCQAAMLRHFRDVSQVMPPEQGRRYLAQMQRLTLGFHEQIEQSMSAPASRQHGHH